MDGTARKAAQAHLEDLALTPATFAPLLLSLVRDQGRGSDTGSSYQRSLSAALALKNVVKKRWDSDAGAGAGAANKQTASNDEEEQDASRPVEAAAAAAAVNFGSDPAVKATLRRDILAALLESGGTGRIGEVSKVLAETFRTIAAADFPAQWPELLPTLSAALKESTASGVRLEQSLLAVAMLSKQFVYFKEKKSSSEQQSSSDEPGSASTSGSGGPSGASSSSTSVPSELEALASEMVLPLLTGALPALAVTITSGAEQAPGDRARCLQCAYLVCKIVHRCTRSYMPSSLHAALSSSESGDRSGATPTLLALLGGIGASLRGKSNSNASGASELEGRLAKRILQLLNNLQVRHEATVIGHLSALLDTVWGCLESSSGGGGGKGLPDLLAALCLDVVAASAEVPSLRIDVFERCVKSLPTVLLPCFAWPAATASYGSTTRTSSSGGTSSWTSKGSSRRRPPRWPTESSPARASPRSPCSRP